MAIPLWRLVAGGLRSLVVQPPVGTGGTVSARYCYSVFMRHRVIAARHGLVSAPRTVLELGPGDSLGIGLMAVLTGSERYIAIDAVRHASLEVNLAVFEELVDLLMHRTPIPDEGECEVIRPVLSRYGFPHDIFDETSLRLALSPERLTRIRQGLITEEKRGTIEYLAPYGEMSGIDSGSVDWIFSQAVLEHVDDLPETYHECFRCLKTDGLMSHQIDYQCHETAEEWNGHWKYPEWFWGVMRGCRPWFVNRQPHSAHLKMQVQAGFEICAEILDERKSEMSRKQLAKKFRMLSDKDLATAGAMLVSRKVREHEQESHGSA